MSTTDPAVLAGEHEQWCYAETHADCCAPHVPMEFGTACDCGRDARQLAIAVALTAERERARAPFMAVIEGLQEEVHAQTQPLTEDYVIGMDEALYRLRVAAEEP